MSFTGDLEACAACFLCVSDSGMRAAKIGFQVLFLEAQSVLPPHLSTYAFSWNRLLTV